MKLLVYVMNKCEKLDNLLHVLTDEGITGATIINSHGMIHQLLDEGYDSNFLSLRKALNPERNESRTIFMVLDDENVQRVVDIIESQVGALEKDDNGIVFTVPVDFTKGLGKWMK